MMQFKCCNCAYAVGQKCLINPNLPFSAEKNSCENFSNILYECVKCGTPLFHKQMLINPKGETFCPNCWNTLNTCATCSNSHQCAFNSSSDEPKVIQKKRNVNGFVIETQEMNPDIIAKTCQKGCVCYSEEIGCLRQNNYCENIQQED